MTLVELRVLLAELERRCAGCDRCRERLWEECCECRALVARVVAGLGEELSE